MKLWWKSKTLWAGVATVLAGIGIDSLRLFVDDPKAVARIMALLGIATIVCRTLGGGLKAKKEPKE